jgi:linoleoyl-CoA desaturase
MMETIAKPIFVKDLYGNMFLQLRHEVNETVKELEPERKFFITLKAVLFPGLYLISYFAVLLWGGNPYILYICYFLMGVLLVLNFLNLIHEAVHNTLFKNKTLNNWYVKFFDLMGANSYIWKIRHTRLHHNYPNVMGWDSDIEQSEMARVFPHGDYSRMHKYQHIYLPFLYPFFLFNWLLIRDFKDFFSKKKVVWKVTSIPAVEYVKLFVFKAVFIFYTLFLPMIILHVSFIQIFAAFLLMMFTASIFALSVLLPPHANTESEFPLPGENGKMPTSWFLHQLSCTSDVAEDNWFIRFFMGCFNYHIAHHLFPSVHHIYYPEVTKVIEQFAAKNNLPYRKFPLMTSLKNHYKLLKQNAFHENIFEETM